MGDKEKADGGNEWSLWPSWLESKPAPNVEEGAKKSHEDKQWEKGIGNRKPEGPVKSENKRELSVGPLLKFKSSYRRAKPKNADQILFTQLLKGEISDLEVGSGTINVDELKARAVIVKLKGEGSVAHAELNVVKGLKHIFGIDDAPSNPQPPPPSPPMPMAARLGDLTAHGTPLAPGLGSANVFIGGLPAWRAGVDFHLCVAPGPIPHGVGAALPGSPTVFINGAPAARASDCLIEASGGPNMIVTGCTTVFIGQQAPPPPMPPKPALPNDKASVSLDMVGKMDVLTIEGDLQAYAEADLKKGRVVAEGQIGGMVALAKAELPIKIQLPIPGTEYHLGLGVTLEASLLSAGVEAGGGVKADADGVGWTGGAKAGFGFGGVGAKFGFECTR